MAANEIKLTLRVNDDGTLGIVGKKAKQAAAGVDQLDKSTKKANKSRNNYQKVEKGVAGATSNSTKGFSKQAGAITGGLVPAYAVLAANVFALTALFGALQRAAAVQQLEQGLIAVGAAAGQNLPYVATQLRTITDLAISSEQAMRATAVAMSAGFSSTQLEKLTMVAKGASLALGRDLGDALDRLVRGTAKLEPEILDELGIMVRLDDAARDYALSLNKAVKDLTRFEKQQAFLNATIDQGTQKFNRIAESVDANPYDKLSASFNDLTKTLLNLANELSFVVEYLASAPTALFGATLAFGSGLAKSVLPTLTEMTEKQRDLSATAAKEAKKARKESVKEYSKLGKSIEGMKFAPPGIKEAAKAYATGSRSAKEMKKDILSLTKSEKLRNVALKTYEAEDSGRSAKFIAEKKAERDAVVALRQEIERLAQTERTRGAISSKENIKSIRSSQTAIQAENLGAMGLGVIPDFKEAAKGSANLLKSVRAASGGLNVLRAGFGAVTGSLKLFGTAIAGAIPVLGQALFVLGLFGPLLSDLFKKSKIQSTLEEVTESFDSFTKTNVYLNDVLKDNSIPLEKKYQAQLKARVGVLGQVEAGINRLAAVDEEQNLQKIAELTEEVIRIEANRAKARGIARRNASKPSGTVDNLKAEIKAIQDALLKVDAASGAALLGAATARLKANKQLAATTGVEIAELEALTLDLLKGGKAADMTWEELKKRIQEITEPSRKLQGAIDGVAQSLKDFDKASQDLEDKVDTPYTNALDALQSLKNEALAVESGVKGVKILDKEQQERLDTFVAKFRELFISQGVAGAGVLMDTEVLERGITLLREYETTIVTSTAKSKELTEEAKKLVKVSKNNEALTKARLDFERKSSEQLLAAKESSLTLLKQTTDESKVKAKTAALDAEIAALRAKIADTAQQTFEIDTARFNGLKQINDALEKQANLQLDIVKAQDDLAKRKALLDRPAGRTTGLTAQEELALFTKNADERKAKETEILNQRLQGIDIEFKLLDIKFALEAQRLDNTLTELSANEKIGKEEADFARQALVSRREGAEGLRDAAQQLALAEAGVTLDVSALEKSKDTGIVVPIAEQPTAVQTAVEERRSEGDVKGRLLEDAALTERRATALETINRLQAFAEASGNKSVALAERKNYLELQRRQLLEGTEAIIQDGKIKEGISVEEQQRAQAILNELDKNELELIKNRIAKREKEVETVTRLGGETAGAFASFGANMMNLTETGGVLAEGSKDVFSEKVAGIAEASQTLISSLRELGPEGEVMASVVQGALNMTEAFAAGFETIKESGIKSSEGITAGFKMAGAAVSAISGMQQAKAKAAVAGIDQEIAAEQKRDGQSAQSVAKIAALEKKKDAVKRKAFEQNKKMQMAEVIMATGVAIMNSIKMGLPWGAVFGSMAAAMGAAQLSAIASTSYQGGGSIANASSAPPSSVAMGSRSNVVDVSQRASGGELAYLRGARGVGTNANDFTPAFTGAKYRASGGETAGYMVGEQGPELFVPETPGRIVPNDDIAQAAPVNVTFSVQAIDASSFNDALTTQRGNIISMIREAANSSGEGFLETVDTNALQMER